MAQASLKVPLPLPPGLVPALGRSTCNAMPALGAPRKRRVYVNVPGGAEWHGTPNGDYVVGAVSAVVAMMGPRLALHGPNDNAGVWCDVQL